MTNKEKFIEIFGVEPKFSVGCSSFKCNNIECTQCTFDPRKSLVGWNNEYKAPTLLHENDLVTYKHRLAIYKYDSNGKAVITYLYDDILINEAVEYKEIKKLGGVYNE